LNSKDLSGTLPGEGRGGGSTLSRRKAQQIVREQVWAALRKVARPDSRFHWDFSLFIADFDGSEHCADRVRALEAYKTSELLFITPDNSLEVLRQRAIEDGKRFLMTTYGIARGFLQLEPTRVPAERTRHAATLDGIEHYASSVSLEDIRKGPKIGLLVTGSSAISTTGVRFGKGHGYFDLEWAILSELGATANDATMVAVGHDCQVVEGDLPTFDHDTIVDWIITPKASRKVEHGPRSRGRVEWDRLSPEMLRSIPSLGELKAVLQGSRT
jgi:5-formyltetrahydrofolate cyclo-ligase